MSAQEIDILDPLNLSSTGVVTALPVSKVFPISSGGLRAIRIDTKVSGVTQHGTITLTLQTGNAVTGWVDAKASAAITAAGVVTIKMNDNVVASDGLAMPLAAHGRIVLTTTDAHDVLTFDAMLVTQAND